MVCDYDDAGQAAWAQSAGIEILRGTGRLDGPGRVTVGDETHLARDVVIATGSDAVIPPIPGLRDLDGVWINREPTRMRAVPRRLLILGAGPVGVELGQAVARMGGEVAIVEGMDRLLAREPAPLGEALADALRADGRVVFTDPQIAAVGDADGPVTATVPLARVPRTATYTRAYAERPGFLTLISDGERLTGAYAIGPDAGEWLQQATVAIRARVPLAVMNDVIQPFPTFSEAFLHAFLALEARVPATA
jgi:pyruvate/2-oxoglutarate dehydrogenase complex dihydrolipoamide dehydrogenase (E3) component